MPSERLKEKITKENLWIYVLSLLERREMYGYELREAVSDNFGFLPGTVTAYRVLYSLKRRGFVSEVDKRKVGGRERRYYRITKKGIAELGKGKAQLRGLLEKL